jgi:hypothetical protein
MTQTTEGTGQGSVERSIPRQFYAQQIIRAQNIIGLEDAVKEVGPRTVDGGELKAMMMGLSNEEMETILKAAEILKRLNPTLAS